MSRKYYKKINKKIEVVEKYLITKIKCHVCDKDIVKNDEYCKITLYPRYPEDCIEYEYCHERCLLDFIKGETYCNSFHIEKDEFYPYEENDIDYFDVEDKEE